MKTQTFNDPGTGTTGLERARQAILHAVFFAHLSGVLTRDSALAATTFLEPGAFDRAFQDWKVANIIEDEEATTGWEDAPTMEQLIGALPELQPERPEVLAQVFLHLREGGTAGPFTFTDWDARSAFVHGIADTPEVTERTPIDGTPNGHLLFLTGGPVHCIEVHNTPAGEAIYRANLASWQDAPEIENAGDEEAMQVR